jgi:hypothetical protein
VLFNQTFIVYLMIVVVIVVTWGLYRTRWGLRLRAVGEHPQAADTVGIKVNPTRFWNAARRRDRRHRRRVLHARLGAAVHKDMTAGLGFIALAAVIFGRWDPVRATLAALLFGFATNLQNLLTVLKTPIPSEFMLMLPYVVTILAVVGFVGQIRGPRHPASPTSRSDLFHDRHRLGRAAPSPPRPCSAPTRRTPAIRWGPRRSSATGASSRAATSRTPRTASGCAPNARSWAICTCPAAGSSSRSSASTGGRDDHALRALPPAAQRVRPAGHAAGDRVRHPHDRRGAAGCLRPARPRGGVAMSAAQSAADAAVEPFDAVDVIRTKRDGGRCPRTPCAG